MPVLVIVDYISIILICYPKMRKTRVCFDLSFVLLLLLSKLGTCFCFERIQTEI
jgi:hypothetical protein